MWCRQPGWSPPDLTELALSVFLGTDRPGTARSWEGSDQGAAEAEGREGGRMEKDQGKGEVRVVHSSCGLTGITSMFNMRSININ